MKKSEAGPVRQRYAVATGRGVPKMACGGPVAKAAPAKPATSYQKYGAGYRKVKV